MIMGSREGLRAALEKLQNAAAARHRLKVR
jgi:hypothetical protein